jgi:leucyl aminopeptidase
MKINFISFEQKYAKDSKSISNQAIVLIANEEKELLSKSSFLNLAEAKKILENYSGKFEFGKAISGFSTEKNFSKIIILSIGKEKEIDELKLEKIGGKIFACLESGEIENGNVLVPSKIKDFSNEELSSIFAYGSSLRGYKFNKYFVDKKEKNKEKVLSINFMVEKQALASKLFDEKKALVDAIFLTRNLVTEPPNVLYPQSYTDIIKKEFIGTSVKLKILNGKDLQKLGFNALLGVGQGSSKESMVVVLEYNGTKKKNEKPLAFVGKGVCFDTGGISIKPSDGMEDMKYDMAGSAVVVGLIKALATRKAKVNVVGVVGLVENMPDGNAQRPSDVVISYSGQSIEILNTDAEGRLVLADCLWYTQEKYKPEFIVDLATLTGAIVVALGSLRAGAFTNNEALVKKIAQAGEKVGEKIWHMPTDDDYDKYIDSKIADVRNTSTLRGGGSVTAAKFLERFVNKTPWVHLDIAGMAWQKENVDLTPEGASGFGVRLLDRFVKDNYEL